MPPIIIPTASIMGNIPGCDALGHKPKHSSGMGVSGLGFKAYGSLGLSSQQFRETFWGFGVVSGSETRLVVWPVTLNPKWRNRQPRALELPVDPLPAQPDIPAQNPSL